jgi:serine/threonine protein kinase
MVGKTVSHYRIIDELGRGGMGIVYAAEDTKLGRRVALKVLAQDVAADHERVQRFIREAQAASAINHPNIATIYEIDEADGLTFIAMELVEGVTLRTKMSAGIPSFDEILDLSRQIARALGKAHELGIVHRDIKPENIVVRPDGLVKILDFGLAKLLQTSESTDATQAMSLTREGAVMGTARYMSPRVRRRLGVLRDGGRAARVSRRDPRRCSLRRRQHAAGSDPRRRGSAEGIPGDSRAGPREKAGRPVR